jgi:Rha family phage regulatory protein
MQQLVIPFKHQATTTSLLVAEKFSKEHKNVLQSIESLECSPEFSRLNFQPSSYEIRGKLYKMYHMTRDGFTFLAMGFTGSLAAKFKEEYLNEFNRMEKILKATTPALIPTYSQRILSEPTKSVPRGYWSVFDKSHYIMFFIEKHIGSVNKYDLVDGSIGTRWAAYRKDKEWAKSIPQSYTHVYDDNRGNQICKCYHNTELEYFEDWLMDIYKSTHLYDYLHTKFVIEHNVYLLEKVEKNLPALLGWK